MLFGSRKPALNKPVVSGSLRIITEDDVMNHCRNNPVSFMCKNCGDTYNAVAVSRQYCNGCQCWLCHRCSGELCAGCKQ